MAKECSVCKNTNPSTANHCTICGNELPDKELTAEEQLRVELHEAKKSKEILEKALADAQKEKDTANQNPVIIEKTVVIQQPAPAPISVSSKDEEIEKKPFPYTILYAGLVLLLMVGGSVIYFAIYKPYVIDRDAPRYYTFSGSNTNLRSTKEAGVPHNIISKLPYGSELLLFRKDADWSDVKWKDPQNNKKKKGFISTAYILPAEDFAILNNIWGDQDSKEIIIDARCRNALIYFAKLERPNNHWKVFSKTKGSKPNTIYFGKIVDSSSKYPDFAVILKNESTGERRCLLFSFDDETETPDLVYSDTVHSAGDIVSVNYNSKTASFTVTYSK